ncbi:MAG: ADP-ribosylation factor-like protein [Promethearchaeia archaeon]
MGLRDLLKRIFTKQSKVVICGLDNSGKSTLVSFLKTGTFVEHTPTMGKDQTTMEVQGVRMDLIDMGGQKDFRSLWLGEMKDADCVIFMVDAADTTRFDEAKKELWKFSSIFEEKPLIVMANKQDLEDISSIPEIIKALDLHELPSFEILPISCKTGFGIVNAFSKIYNKLTGKRLDKKVAPKAITVFDRGGVPLTTKEGEYCSEDILQGGLIAAITNYVKKSFQSELSQVRMEGHTIIIKRTSNLMGSVVLEQENQRAIQEAEAGLVELLDHIEKMCPELQTDQYDPEKVDYLVQQYATNLL